jgi:hypothetical protein
VTGNTRTSTQLICSKTALAVDVSGTILALPFFVVFSTSLLDSRCMFFHSRLSS